MAKLGEIEDATIAALALDEREEVGAVWLERARSELGAAQAFAQLASEMIAGQAGPELCALTARAVADEVRHARLCLEVASRYLGRDLPWPTPRAGRPIRLAGDPAQLRLQHAVLASCINESIAAAYLQAAGATATAPLAKAAIHELMRDEVDHARIGWAMLGAASEDQRRAIARVLPRLLEAVRDGWIARSLDSPETLPEGHGCPRGSEVQRLVDEALRELIVPGFEHLGLDLSATRAWLELASSTSDQP